MDILKFQNSGKLPFWFRLAKQLQSAPSNGETTIAAHNADLNRQVEQARKEAKSKGENPNRAEEEVYKRGLRTNGTIVGGVALGALATAAPAVAETVKFATKTPVGKKALQKAIKETAISMAGGTAVDALSDKMTGMSFGRYVAGAIPGARNLYDRSGLARFGIDMLNPGYLGLSGSKALIEGTQKGVTNLAHNIDNAATIANARLTGKLKFGNPTTYTGIHQSNTPITKIQFPFNRWDVTTHGADPNGFWLTLAETPNAEGTMASRPFASRWTATAQKPLIQTGEIENLFKGKNNLRNAIVRYGKRRGADAFEFRRIKDNALPTTDVVMVTDKTNPIYKGGIAKVNYAGPTTGKTTYIKANPNSGNVDLDAIPEYKALRQQIADKLGLDYRNPKVTYSPEYQEVFNQFISKWSQDVNNTGKTLWGSSKALLRSNLPLSNDPFIPDLPTFKWRNQDRGFKEDSKQLMQWWVDLMQSYPKMKIDNRFIGEKYFGEAPVYQIKNLGGGYMLKSLMRGNPLEKQLSKQGTVNVNNVRTLTNKGSDIEKAIVDKVLSSEEFANKKTIDYNKFRKAVQDELITYDRTSDIRYNDYGMSKLDAQYGKFHDKPFDEVKDALNEYAKSKGYRYEIYEDEKTFYPRYINDKGHEITVQDMEIMHDTDMSINNTLPSTFTFSSPRIPNGSAKHYNSNTLGHSRTYTTADEPDVLHVMESQSDWAQEGIAHKRAERIAKAEEKYPGGFEARRNKAIRNAEEQVEKWKNMLKTGISGDGHKLEAYELAQIRTDFLYNAERKLREIKEMYSYVDPQELYLSNNFTTRQIQENLRYAAEKGQTKMRYPTRETAAKIENYSPTKDVEKSEEVFNWLKQNNRKSSPYSSDIYDITQKLETMISEDLATPEDIKRLTAQIKKLESLESRWLNGETTYDAKLETILDKYTEFPKQFKKLFKDADIRMVTDPKRNTWYEVDVPDDYLRKEWQYKQGGRLKRK